MTLREFNLLLNSSPISACDILIKIFSRLDEDIEQVNFVRNERKLLVKLETHVDLKLIDSDSFYQQKGDIVERLKNIVNLNSDVFVKNITEQEVVSGPINSINEVTQVDWGNSPSVGYFFGRSKEILRLEEWVLVDKVKIISVVGLKGVGKTKAIMKFGKGGVGKTDLTTKLANGIQQNFDFVIWRRLLNAPLLKDLLSDLYFFFTGIKFDPSEDSTKYIMDLLKEHIEKYRCLIILDNVESIIKSKTNQNSQKDKEEYLEGYEDYGVFFKFFGSVNHNSTLIITSRENPEEIYQMSRKNGPVRTFNLGGIDVEACKKIFLNISEFHGDEMSWKKINDRYQGNPLALELSARHIESVYFGDIDEFLNSGKSVFKDLHQLIEWHFQRLSLEERAILICLAINREPMDLKSLKGEFIFDKLKTELPSNLQSIQRKIPIERHGYAFSIQPVLIEFVTDYIIETVNSELFSDKKLEQEALISAVLKDFKDRKYIILNRFSLMKAVSKEYIRQSQHRLIVQPIIKHLTFFYRNKEILKLVLNGILQSLRSSKSYPLGYLAGNILNLLSAIDGSLNNVNASKLFIRQASLQGINVHGCNFDDSDFAKTSFTQTYGAVMGVDFSDDEKLLIIGDSSGVISCFDIEAEKLIFSFKAHDSSIEAIFFSNEHNSFISGSTDKTVKVWDFDSQKCTTVFKGHNDWVREIAISRKNKRVLSVSEDRSVISWNLPNQNIDFQKKYHKSWVDTVDIDEDKNVFGCSGHHGEIYICNLEDGEKSSMLTNPTNQWIRELKFLEKTNLLAATGNDGKIHIFNYVNNELVVSLSAKEEDEGLLTLCYNPSTKVLAAAGESGRIQLWDIPSRKCFKILTGHSKRVRSVRFSSIGNYLCSAGEDKHVRIWDTDKYRCLVHLDGYTNRISSSNFNKEGNLIISGSEDGCVRIWGLDGACVKTIYGHTAQVFDAKFANKKSKIISVSKDHSIRIWNSKTYELIEKLNEHEDWIWACSIDPQENKFATCSEDLGNKKLIVWDLITHKLLGRLEGHTGRVWNMDFDPTGSYLVSCSGDFTVRSWDLREYSCLHVMSFHQGRVWAVKYSNCGTKIISCGDDGKIIICDSASGNLIDNIDYESVGIRTIAMHPVENIFASGSDDGKVTVWDLSTLKMIVQFSEHTQRVTDVNFDPNGKLLVSSSEDNQIKVWTIDNVSSLKTIYNPRPYEKSSFKNVAGLTDSQLVSLKQLGAKL